MNNFLKFLLIGVGIAIVVGGAYLLRAMLLKVMFLVILFAIFGVGMWIAAKVIFKPD